MQELWFSSSPRASYGQIHVFVDLRFGFMVRRKLQTSQESSSMHVLCT